MSIVLLMLITKWILNCSYICLFDFQEGEGDEDGEDEGDDGEDEGWTAMETIIHCYHSFISCDSCWNFILADFSCRLLIVHCSSSS